MDSGSDAPAGRRILIVSNFYPPAAIGGAEVVAARQARALSDAGHLLAVFAGAPAGDALEPGALERAEDPDGRFTVFRVGHISLDPEDNFFRPEVARRFAAVLAYFDPEIVHFHNVAGLGVNLIPLAKAHGARVALTLHDHWGFCFKNTRLRNDLALCHDFEDCALCRSRMATGNGPALPVRLRRDYVAWCVGHADHLISPSRYMAETYDGAGLLTRPVEAISNGIDLDAVPVPPARISRAPLQFVCAAYLGVHKGIPQLLEAAERLAAISELGGHWHLTIAGHGDLAGALESDIASGRFAGSVTYVGRLSRTEMLALLGRSDAVVLPSIWPENEPVTMLEAIASGVAQIATRIGGNVDLVEDGKSGLLVEPGDGPGLAAAMERLIRDPDLARRFGDRNLARREAFDEAATVERLVALYERPASAASREELLVICAGEPSGRQLDLMMHRFHVAEAERCRVRFVWHGWIGADGWSAAALLWMWSASGVDEASLAMRALRAGIPILAPSGSALAGLSTLTGLPTYDTLLDALGIIAAMAELPPSGRHVRPAAATAARMLCAVLPRPAFHLSSELAR